MKSRYPIGYQVSIVREYLLGQGKRRPSAAAMEMSGLSEDRRRKMFRNIMTLIEEGVLERRLVPGEGWRILGKEKTGEEKAE